MPIKRPMISSRHKCRLMTFVLAMFFFFNPFRGNCLAQEAASSSDASELPASEDPAYEDSASEPQATQSKSFEELQKDPEYQAEVEKRTGAFDAGRIRLAEALSDQFATMVRYRNGQAKSKPDTEHYFEARQRVRSAMDDLYLLALELSRISASQEAAQYIVTMVRHRVEHGIYDYGTAEGAARMIDGGGKLLFLFQGAARSAVVSGQFEIARNVYKAMSEEQFEDIDRRLFYNLDELKQDYQQEQEILKKEAKADDLPRVMLRTSEGEVVLELFLDQAPSTVANFIRLVEEGFYDGLDFYQVIDDLLALNGDPSGLGDGNSGKFLIDENVRPDARHGLRGSLVMAKIPMSPQSADFLPDSSSSQFAILMVPIPGIEKEQTVFGRVVSGMNNIAALRRVDPSKEKKKNEITLPSDYIVEATVIRRPDVLPEPKYLDVEQRVKEFLDQKRSQGDHSKH